MTQRLEQMNASLSANIISNNEQPSQNILISAFEQAEIQSTLEKTKLKSEQLTHIPNYDKIPASTRRLKPLNNFLGQDRARASVEAGIALPYSGYNIFAVGTAGLGKRTMVKRLLQQHAKTMPTPNDWVYVYNFKLPRQPIALELPSGQAAKFQTMLHQAWKTILKQLERRFTAEIYHNRIELIRQHTGDEQQLALIELTKEGETLDLEINHSIYSENQDASFLTTFNNPNIPSSSYTDNLGEKRNNSTINLDYVNPLNDKTNLELGAESRIVRTENNYITNNNSLSNSDYTYDLDIYSAYATFGQKFKKIGYQLGARFESYKVNAMLNGATAYKDDYFTIYPSASMTYSPTDKNQFQISLSRRVDRPGLDQTKPIREFSTPRVTSIGNPELDPQFTNSIELNYTKTIAKGTFTTGLFVRSIHNEINRILYPDPENQDQQIMSFDNFDNNTAYGFEVSLNYKINSWWDIQPAIDFSSINQKGLVSVLNTSSNSFDLVSKEVTASAFNARFNSNFKATKSLRFLLFGFYRSGVDGVQFNGKEMYKIDAGGRYSFLKDKATLSVRFNDIFNTMKAGFDGQNPYPQVGQFTWESQSVYLGFNYIFGAGKNKSLQRKQRDNNTKQDGGGLF